MKEIKELLRENSHFEAIEIYTAVCISPVVHYFWSDVSFGW